MEVWQQESPTLGYTCSCIHECDKKLLLSLAYLGIYIFVSLAVEQMLYMCSACRDKAATCS